VPVDDACVARSDGNVGQQAGDEARADGRTMHCRDHDLRAVDQVVDQIARFAPHARPRLEILRHLFDQIQAAAARVTFPEPADDRNRNLRIGIHIAPDLGELAMHLRVGHSELALAPHHDFQNARLRPLEREALVLGVSHASDLL
jgi:hypothetical protein